MGVIKESFLFPGLFKGDKFFWATAWLFHVSLALIIVGHLRVLTGVFDKMFISFGMNQEGINTMSSVSGGIAGIVIMLAAFILILRRMSSIRVREISLPSDYLALIFVLAILITGNLMRFGAHFDLELTRVYFSGIFSLSATEATIPQNAMFLVHFFLVQILVIYIPFSKILHFGGIFFTQTLIQKS
ncbi:MAG: respiratory nitrate reductase subunit gamma [candidate division Zixibacteria bacterium]